MNLAIENDIKNIYSPTADLVIENTDPSRSVQPELFRTIYDKTVNEYFQAKREGKWWAINVARNRDRIVIPAKKQEPVEDEKTICLCHDIERHIGHIDADPRFAEIASKNSSRNLEEMLAIEKEVEVKATYNVLGCLLDDVREEIETDRHCIAFHSYDHKISKDWTHSLIKVISFIYRDVKNRPRYRYGGQLNKCRQVDYRIKGYRPPQSRLTPELSDDNLCFHNFEWLASSAYSLKTKQPVMQNRVVKIPVLFDDFDMYKNGMSYGEWEKKAIEKIEENEFVAFSLHDCYAHYWLPHYRNFLQKIKGLGQFKNLNEVANDVISSSSKNG